MDEKIKFIEEEKIKSELKKELSGLSKRPVTDPIRANLVNFVKLKKNFKDLF